MSQFPPKKVVAITPLAPQIDRGAPCSHVNPASQGTAFGSFAVPCEAGTCFLPVGNSKMKEQRPFRRRLFLRRHHPPIVSRSAAVCGIIRRPRRPAAPPKPFNTIRAKFPRVAAAIPVAARTVETLPSILAHARRRVPCAPERAGRYVPRAWLPYAHPPRPTNRPRDRPGDRPGRPGGGARAKSGAGPVGGPKISKNEAHGFRLPLPRHASSVRPFRWRSVVRSAGVLLELPRSHPPPFSLISATRPAPASPSFSMYSTKFRWASLERSSRAAP